jgi:SAM-dependent methyltransferase
MSNQNDFIYRKLQANLYDANYSEKDYTLESNFILKTVTNNSDRDISELNILDVGCGTGTHLSLLSGKFANLVGVDSSPDMISLARQKFNRLKNTKFLNFNIDELSGNFIPNYFDVVTLLYSVSGYLGPVANLINKIKSLSSLMSNNAILILDYWDVRFLNFEYEILRHKLLEFGDARYRKTSVGKIDSKNSCVDANISWEKIGSGLKWSEVHKVYCYDSIELIKKIKNLNFRIVLDTEDGKDLTPIIDNKSRWLVAIKSDTK